LEKKEFEPPRRQGRQELKSKKIDLELMNSGKYNPAIVFQSDQALYFLFREFLSSRFKIVSSPPFEQDPFRF
jgi:hypothetical protein